MMSVWNSTGIVRSDDVSAEYAFKGRKVTTMEITDMKIRKLLTTGRLRAIISITLDHMIAIHDIKVVQSDTRLFVAMPSRKDESGVFRDIVHPINAEARRYLENQIRDVFGLNGTPIRITIRQKGDKEDS